MHSATEIKSLKYIYTSSLCAESSCTLHAAKLAAVPVCSFPIYSLVVDLKKKKRSEVHLLGETWVKVTLKLFFFSVTSLFLD